MCKFCHHTYSPSSNININCDFHSGQYNGRHWTCCKSPIQSSAGCVRSNMHFPLEAPTPPERKAKVVESWRHPKHSIKKEDGYYDERETGHIYTKPRRELSPMHDVKASGGSRRHKSRRQSTYSNYSGAAQKEHRSTATQETRARTSHQGTSHFDSNVNQDEDFLEIKRQIDDQYQAKLRAVNDEAMQRLS